MARNPYQAPDAAVADPAAKVAVAVPGSVLRDIRNGWIVAVISGIITLVFTMISTVSTPVFGFSAWEFMDVALIFGLAYGIHRRSRICAVVLLAYFVYAKIVQMQEKIAILDIALALVFIYYFLVAAIATFHYHKAQHA